jgi:hypothetical protein
VRKGQHARVTLADLPARRRDAFISLSGWGGLSSLIGKLFEGLSGCLNESLQRISAAKK